MRGIRELVAEALERVDGLSPAEVAEAIEGGGGVLVDVREQGERVRHGAIDGDLHVPRAALEFAADPSLPSHPPDLDPDRRVILYCASGVRSALAGHTLLRMGYTRVAHLTGGLHAWVADGRPVERSGSSAP